MLENDEVQGRCPKCDRLRLFGGNPPRKICPACDLTVRDGVDVPRLTVPLVNRDPAPTEAEFAKTVVAPKRDTSGLSLLKTEEQPAVTDNSQLSVKLDIPRSLLPMIHSVVDKARKKEKSLHGMKDIVELLIKIEKEIK